MTPVLSDVYGRVDELADTAGPGAIERSLRGPGARRDVLPMPASARLAARVEAHRAASVRMDA